VVIDLQRLGFIAYPDSQIIGLAAAIVYEFAKRFGHDTSAFRNTHGWPWALHKRKQFCGADPPGGL